MRTTLLVLVFTLYSTSNAQAQGQNAASDSGRIPLRSYSDYAKSNPEGQFASSGTGSPSQRDAILLAIGKSIPNPNLVLKTVAFLRDEVVAGELRLDETQRTEIKKLLDEALRQPGVIFMQFADGKEPPRDERLSLNSVMRKDRESRSCQKGQRLRRKICGRKQIEHDVYTFSKREVETDCISA